MPATSTRPLHQITPAAVLRHESHPPLLVFFATAAEILQIARIERAGRTEAGTLTGFQRPAIEDHIQAITAYLNSQEAFLPNAIILGFTAPTASLADDGTLSLNLEGGPAGWIVDGQQRLLATLAAEDQSRPLLVAAFLASDNADLKRFFVLVNSVRPLPRALIYEILPGLDALPPRLTDQTAAALLVETLNYRPESSLRGQIHQMTNPQGVVRDTALLRIIRNSLRAGALSHLAGSKDLIFTSGVDMVSAFFAAVQDVFASDWKGHTPRTSRLVHGAGVIALGAVMEALAAKLGAHTQVEFAKGLRPLLGHTAWTSGTWNFETGPRTWNSLQNVAADYTTLTRYLLAQLGLPEFSAAAGDDMPPLEDAA